MLADLLADKIPLRHRFNALSNEAVQNARYSLRIGTRATNALEKLTFFCL